MTVPTEQLLRDALRDDVGDVLATDEIWTRVRHDGQARRRRSRVQRLIVSATSATRGCGGGRGLRSDHDTFVAVLGQHCARGSPAGLRERRTTRGVRRTRARQSAGPSLTPRRARWVPHSWYFNEGCGGEVPHDAVCAGSSQAPLPTEGLTLIAASTAHDGEAPARVVHGYRLYRSTHFARRGFEAYDVPELGVSIAVRGVDASRILSTLAPSGRTVALASATANPPGTWQRIIDHELSLSAPSQWTIPPPEYLPCTSAVRDNVAFRVKAGSPGGVVSCPDIEPTIRQWATEGVIIYEPGSADTPKPTGPPLAVFHHGSTTIAVYRTIRDPGPFVDPNVMDAPFGARARLPPA